MNREQTLRRSENQQPQKECLQEDCHFLFMLVCERQVFSCWFLLKNIFFLSDQKI